MKFAFGTKREEEREREKEEKKVDYGEEEVLVSKGEGRREKGKRRGDKVREGII